MIAPTFSFYREAMPQGITVMPLFSKHWLSQNIPALKNFKDEVGQTILIHTEHGSTLYAGVGDPAKFDEASARKLGAAVYKVLKAQKIEKASLSTSLHAAEIADGMLIESYVFDKYKTKKEEYVLDLLFNTPDAEAEKEAFDKLKTITESQFWASNLVNEPGNALNPNIYANEIKRQLEPLGIKVKTLGPTEMDELGMHSALAVGRGSAHQPRMVVMEYDGTQGAQKRPLALVGKGITFDSGGISIKPDTGMADMKMDMAGSAAVVGAMRALAATKTKTKVVAIVALAENMPGGNSYRPGDILKSMNGKTIFVDNTDAEGRLVLCDAMTYIQRTYKPHTVVDLATLTGAAKAALGTKTAAVFANNEKLWRAFNKASQATGERVWRMPLGQDFTDAVRKTPDADITNLAGAPGASTAAAFLQEFVEGKTKWAHIDMAGPGIWSDSARRGWGVRLLTQAVKNGL